MINGQECAGGACSKTLASRKSVRTQMELSSSGREDLTIGAGAVIKGAAGE